MILKCKISSLTPASPTTTADAADPTQQYGFREIGSKEMTEMPYKRSLVVYQVLA